MGILVSAPLLIPLASSLLLYSIRRRHQLTQIFAIFTATLLFSLSPSSFSYKSTDRGS